MTWSMKHPYDRRDSKLTDHICDEVFKYPITDKDTIDDVPRGLTYFRWKILPIKVKIYFQGVFDKKSKLMRQLGGNRLNLNQWSQILNSYLDKLKNGVFSKKIFRNNQEVQQWVGEPEYHETNGNQRVKSNNKTTRLSQVAYNTLLDIKNEIDNLFIRLKNNRVSKERQDIVNDMLNICNVAEQIIIKEKNEGKTTEKFEDYYAYLRDTAINIKKSAQVFQKKDKLINGIRNCFNQLKDNYDYSSSRIIINDIQMKCQSLKNMLPKFEELGINTTNFRKYINNMWETTEEMIEQNEIRSELDALYSSIINIMRQLRGEHNGNVRYRAGLDMKYHLENYKINVSHLRKYNVNVSRYENFIVGIEPKINNIINKAY